jgi:hypothetical protein
VVWLQAFRAAAGAICVLALSFALEVTFNDKPDSTVAYVGYYGAAGTLLLVAVALTAMIAKRHARQQPASPEAVSAPPERHIVNVTPAYLVGLFDGHTSIQGSKLAEAFIGKWMRLSGPLGDVRGSSKHHTQVTFESNPPTETGRDFFVFMYFPKTADERLATLPHGTPITVLGRITEVDRVSLELDDCELADP